MIVIIGGGASGLVSAISLARNNHKVTIFERNSEVGKKLLLTGNSKCNYFNESIKIDDYYSNDYDVLKEIITKENQKEALKFFDSIGIIPRIKNGCYYPYSNMASSIQYALLKEAKNLGVNIIKNTLIENITIKNRHFIVNGIEASKLILATGSKAMPKTGSDGIGYQIAKQFNHKIIKPLPALVGLKASGKFNEWARIRTDAQISLYIDSKKVKESSGEAQLTDYGISGICIFNLSSLVSRSLENSKKVELKIDFLPNIDNLLCFLNERNKLLLNRNISELFDSLLNYKLVNFLLKKSNINPKKNYDELTKKEKNNLTTNFKSFNLEIIGYNDFSQAQVCTGGIPLNEINPYTMESLKTKNLYLIGELLDVDGICGGYNLAFAWISALIVGRMK